jgi:hypothetical protein
MFETHVRYAAVITAPVAVVKAEAERQRIDGS